MGALLMGRSKKVVDDPGSEPASETEAPKKQIWVYLRDARDVGLLTNYLHKAQPDVFAEVLRKALMERVALEEAKRAKESNK